MKSLLRVETERDELTNELKETLSTLQQTRHALANLEQVFMDEFHLKF